MKKYLSHGMGVNSTALMLLLIDEDIEFESVFSDTGCEKPETYKYLDLLKERGYEITRITPSFEGTTDLYDYMWSRKLIPIIHVRMCTSRFKSRPIDKYVEKPCEVMIGYDFSERGKRHIKNRGRITFTFPLIDRRIGRQRCIEIIMEHGLPVPMKSSCYICPFQSKKQWRWLKGVHPDLFKKAMALEENARTRDPEKTLYGKKCLSSIWQEYSLDDYMRELNDNNRQ